MSARDFWRGVADAAPYGVGVGLLLGLSFWLGARLGDGGFIFALGLAVGLCVSVLSLNDTWKRAYSLGLRHGREKEVTAQWGADVREALAAGTRREEP